jgi:hypothetical protein
MTFPYIFCNVIRYERENFFLVVEIFILLSKFQKVIGPFQHCPAAAWPAKLSDSLEIGGYAWRVRAYFVRSISGSVKVTPKKMVLL